MAASMISPTERGRRSGTSTGASVISRGEGGPGRVVGGVTDRSGGSRPQNGELQRLDQGGVALAATAAEGGGAEPAAAAAQRVDQRHDDPGAGHADRVAKGDGAAVDVDDLVGDAEVGAVPSRPSARDDA